MGAHSAPLSCGGGWCPLGNKGVAAILGCEATLCDLAEASGCLSAALSPHPAPLSLQKWSPQTHEGRGAGTYLVQRLGGQLRCFPMTPGAQRGQEREGVFSKG